jgi:hypothetical protein
MLERRSTTRRVAAVSMGFQGYLVRTPYFTKERMIRFRAPAATISL